MTEPCDLTDPIPNDGRAELAVAVAALEKHDPAVTEALRQLDQATTATWQALNPVEPTEDEWRLVERGDRHRPWLGFSLSAGFDA